MESPAEEPRYTFADALTWGEDERIEIIDGQAFMMAPPLRVHQKISGELFGQLREYLKGKKYIDLVADAVRAYFQEV